MEQNNSILSFFQNSDFEYIELHIPEYLNETYSLAISYGFKYKNSHEIITAKKEIIKIDVLKKDLRN